jgi:hypothetical protein
MNTTEKYEVFLQPFSNEITEDLMIEFTCSKCKKKVISKPKVQAGLSTGGVGHKCDNCGSYLALICCPLCKATLTIDDEEWEALSNPKGSECPTCGAVLYRKKWGTGATMVSSGIMCPGLTNWSSTKIESAYLSKVRPKLQSTNKNLFAIKHHSIGVRMKSSKDSMQYLLENKWYSPMVMSNTSSPIKESLEYKTPFDHDFHNNLFSFINNLRSALDILSQEICFHSSPNAPEKKIDFFKIDQFIGAGYEDIKQSIIEFRESDLFVYLNKLRNVLQHRRIPLMVSLGAYDTAQLDTIKPKNLRSLAAIKLPKDPDEFDEIQTNNSFTIPVFQKIEELYSKTEEFILNIYNNIKP